MPAGAVENHQRVAAVGNRRRDVQQVPVHLVGVGPVVDVADRHAGFRKDGGEQVAVSVSVVPRDPWAGAALRPDPCRHDLLPDSRLVLETQVDAGQIDARKRSAQR